MGWITRGIVNVLNGSSNIAGGSTKFLTDGRIGDGFRGPDGRLYEVTNIATDFSLTINPPYEGPTLNSAPYYLVPIEGYVKDSADQLRAATQQIVAIPNTKQDKSANLTALSALAGQADRLIYFPAADTLAMAPFTAKARALMAASTNIAWQVEMGISVATATDPTPGKFLNVGYMGLGSKNNAPWQGTSLNPDDYLTGGCLIGQFLILGEALTGFLVTLPGSNASVCGQQFTDLSNSSYLTRVMNGSAWGTWVRHTGTHSVTTFNIDAAASFIGSTDRFFSTPETTGSIPFQYGFVRFMAMANNNFKQVAYEGVNTTATGSHIASRTYFGGVWSPWIKALNTGDHGVGGNNLYAGNVDQIVAAAPLGTSFWKLTSAATGPLPPASTTHEGNTLQVDKWDGNNATIIYRSRGAQFIRGVLDGAWTTAVWNLMYNAGNLTNPVDAARYGIMDSQTISGWRVVRWYNGFMVASMGGPALSFAANESKPLSYGLPVSFPDYGKCSVTAQLVAAASWDHYGAIQAFMGNPTAANLVVRNGAGGQTITLQNLTVSGYWK
ncbi:putative tail fiber protein [Pseudomonas phage UAntarctica]|nr:putative tail fiber protein [Pseudomonas phage UAntarctica]